MRNHIIKSKQLSKIFLDLLNENLLTYQVNLNKIEMKFFADVALLKIFESIEDNKSFSLTIQNCKFNKVFLNHWKFMSNTIFTFWDIEEELRND